MKVMSLDFEILNIARLLDQVRDSVEERRPRVLVGVYPALSLQLLRDRRYRLDMASSELYPDGQGCVWALRLAGLRVPVRLATTDIVWPLLGFAASRSYSVLLYGGKRDVVSLAAERFRETFPTLNILGAFHGYQELDQAVLKELQPDIILVGRGAPVQERWAHDVAVRAGVPVSVTCGGLFDFVAMRRRRAPDWMQRSGLEWMFRTRLEPRRLLLRYLAGNALFVAWVCWEHASARFKRVLAQFVSGTGRRS